MGQRLVVTIKKNNIVLANAYYHWSAYTDSALGIAHECIASFKRTKYKTDIEKAIDMLYETGAGIYSTPTNNKAFFEHKAQNPFFSIPYVVSNDRNTGMIGISKDTIDDLQDASEGDVIIDIGTQMVDFCVWYAEDVSSLVENECYDKNIEYDELSEEEIDQMYNKIVEGLKTVDYPYEEISFDDFTDFVNKVHSAGYTFKLSDGTIIGKIA